MLLSSSHMLLVMGSPVSGSPGQWRGGNVIVALLFCTRRENKIGDNGDAGFSLTLFDNIIA